MNRRVAREGRCWVCEPVQCSGLVVSRIGDDCDHGPEAFVVAAGSVGRSVVAPARSGGTGEHGDPGPPSQREDGSMHLLAGWCDL